MSPASSASRGGEPQGPLAHVHEHGSVLISEGSPGRASFQAQLRDLEENALGGLDLIVEQLDRVLEALHHQDVELA